MRPVEGNIADWALKLAGAIVRIASILWLINNSKQISSGPDRICADSMQRAIEIGRYLIQHALAAFAKMGADEQVEKAKWLLRWIQREHLVSFSRRDAHQAHKGLFRRVDEIDPILHLLESHNYIRPRSGNSNPRPGCKSSQIYNTNPVSLLLISQSSQFSESQI